MTKKCEYSQEGYRTYGNSVEEQLDSETQWECPGSEEEMQICGMSESSR